MGTVFEENIWNLCQKIPQGKVTTYKLLAKAAGHSRASRSVDNTLNKNNFLVKIPCHRVVKSNGSVGNYVKGKEAKKRLL
ncbi:MAG: MGMT family protein [Patescibacteria group bacterium]|nr:MGMT family protein [Patescibacteria group bacterium]